MILLGVMLAGGAALTLQRRRQAAPHLGTRAAQSGASLFLVARAMGHKRMSTTERYAKHETDSLRGVISAVGRGK